MRALAVLALAACGGSAPPAKPPANHVEDTAAKTAEDELGFLPADSDFVVGFELGAFRATALGHELAPQLRQMFEHALEGAPWASCAAGWSDSVERVTLGMKVGDGNPSGVVVIRGLDAVGALPCFERALRTKEQAVTSERGVVVAPGARGNIAFVAAGAATLVLVIHGDTNHAAIAAMLAGGTPLRGTEAFLGIYDHVHRGATLWMVGNGAAKWLASQNIRASELDGNVIATDKLVIAGKMTTDSPATAATLAQSAQQSLPMIKQMFDSIDIHAVAGTVVLDAAMTKDQFVQLLALFGVR